MRLSSQSLSVASICAAVLSCSAEGSNSLLLKGEDGSASDTFEQSDAPFGVDRVVTGNDAFAIDAGVEASDSSELVDPPDAGADAGLASDAPSIADRIDPSDTPDDSCGALTLGSALGMRVATGTTAGRASRVDTASCGLPMAGARGGTMAGEVVYRWIAPTSGTFTFNTVGSAFDTLLYVRDGGCSGRDLACNDDISGTMNTLSSLDVTLSAGQSVLIVVDGFGSNSGAFVLNIARRDTACIPMCSGRTCGTDGCSGMCGTCPTGQTCNTAGRCEVPADPCSSVTDCAACTGRSACGWCSAMGRCSTGTTSGPTGGGACGGRWAWVPMECTAPADGGTVDPRSEAERTCPTGATLRIQLREVAATPLNPSSEQWDGPGATKQGLACRATAYAVRSAVQAALNSMAPDAGETFDRWLGGIFEGEVARLCGIGLNWVVQRYAGPDMFAIGYSGATRLWQTPAEQDTWRAPRVPGAWTTAVWRIPCQSSTASIAFDVIDEDLALDDTVERVSAIPVRNIPPAAICAGRGVILGTSGMAQAVMGLSVEGATPSCEGISSDRPSSLIIRP